jgi:hypothetical protein
MTERPPKQPGSQGTSASYIRDRLRREKRTDLAAAVESGTLSAFAAGEAAGFLRRPPVLGTGSKNQQRQRQHRLQAIADGGSALREMGELWLGPGSEGSLFSSREELEQAWHKHRAQVMAMWARGGRRPAIWWEFEAGMAYPGYANERSVLWRHDFLGAEERTELEAEWKLEFAKAHKPNFFVGLGGGVVLTGAAARRRHFEHCDIPIELRTEWRWRRRRKRTLSEASCAEGEERNGLGSEPNPIAETME